MGETRVQFGREQLEVVDYIRTHLGEWITQSGILNSQRERELDQRERIIRVEESLKNQHELIQKGFEYTEKQFLQMEKRFEQMEKRFEAVDKRFEAVDKRFEAVDVRFTELREDMRTQFNRVHAFMTGLFLTIIGGFIAVIFQFPG